ncbi:MULTISPECIES: sigma D regulator [Vibrio]|uniref:sigma D regulator n=1 Tax=Vibrio TaxID=662 RepID=UPI000C1638B4|nr:MULTISPECIES: sigma D regulator [Vibrio]NAW69656.1 sigma D regulator [Vibrio sp. V28_P6S34P95]NAX06139.1 sigma D regulator [Vibrio sp. V30_P3S12P165]NAX34197.1 sigma D regulator [Vibrio sp. V29_P1S30P107]NAX36387.1 sigma D regulator [Vibrio sp. V27_P1S3P104]NAX39980.1 sigma D regulator [Vibrio sp. V26_P1S5P106]
MLKKLKKTQEQWGGSSDVIDHWLDKRQQLLVEYCQLAVTAPLPDNQAFSELPSLQAIQYFSQELVDYISEGHFKIYDMVMNKWQATGFKATDEINQTYAQITQTNDPLLNFADRYATLSGEDDLESFDDDLSKVGEVLESRFELEDYLIQLIADSLSIPPGA